MKNMPLEMRPREKLISMGSQTLTDTELLAILLRTGTKGRSVLQMSKELLEQFDGVAGLLNTTAVELKQFKGLGGVAKRAELISVLELAKRALEQQVASAPIFNNPKAVEKYLQLQIGNEKKEIFAALFLDTKLQLITMKKLFFGTLDQSSIYPREVVIQALQHNAHAVVLAHNHPSGDVTPSLADQEVTQKIKEALQTVDIKTLDHIIVSKNNALSLAANGYF